jgi:hypothetical protein
MKNHGKDEKSYDFDDFLMHGDNLFICLIYLQIIR